MLYSLPFVPLLLAEETAAVLLAVKPHLPGLPSSFAKAPSPVIIQKGYPGILTCFLTQPAQEIVLLPRTDQEARGETVTAFLFGETCGLSQAHCITETAAVLFVKGNFPEIELGMVSVRHLKGYSEVSRHLQSPFPALAVLLKGMDVRVVKIACHLVALFEQILHRVNGAGAATNVHQYFHL